MPWMTRLAGRVPAVLRPRPHGASLHRRRRHRVRRLLPRRHRGDGRSRPARRWPRPSPRRPARASPRCCPTTDAAWVAEELARRFGLPTWQMAMTATDANRFVLRFARHLTGRPKVLVIDWCYHGTVDETFAVLDADGRTISRAGQHRPAGRPGVTTMVVPFNDVDALEAALRDGRRRLRAGRAGAHQHRHRAARPGLPRRACASSPAGTARCSSSTRPTRSASAPVAPPRPGASSPTSSSSARPSAAACRSPPTACTAEHRRPHRRPAGGHERRHQRRRRHPHRQRPGARRRAGHAVADAARGRLRAHDPARHRVGRRRAGDDRRAAACRGTCSSSVPAPSTGSARRRATAPMAAAAVDARARRVHAPVGDQPRHPAHAVPQHGAALAASHQRSDVDRHTEVFAAAVDALVGTR